MILRRIADHLKAQRWTALGLELLVVVIGLFLATNTTVSNWSA